MEKYVKPDMEIVEIPGYANITADTCPGNWGEEGYNGEVGE